MRSKSSKIFTGFMLVLFLLNTNYVLLYYGTFKLNQENLAETVCEKKTVECNACCYLNKKIEQESDETKGTAQLIKIKQGLSEFTVNYFSFDETQNTTSKLFSDIYLNPSKGFLSLPGKPPQFA